MPWQPGEPRDFLGGSDAATLLGLSKWSSRYALWAQLAGLVVDEHDDETLARFAMGHRAEAFIAKCLEDDTGLVVAGEQLELFHVKHPFLRAHVDGLLFDSHTDEPSLNDALGVFEAKTAAGYPWDEVPVNYQCQAVWACGLAGLDRCVFGVLFDRFKFKTYEVPASPEDFENMVEIAVAFWNEHVLTGVPPEVDASEPTRKALDRAYDPDPDAEAQVPDDMLVQLAESKAQAKVADEWVTFCENNLKARMGDATTARDSLGNKATWRPQTATRVAGLAEITRVSPDLVESLTEHGLVNESVSRVLRLTMKKGTS
jgi:predicted phage-related endonuclease